MRACRHARKLLARSLISAASHRTGWREGEQFAAQLRWLRLSTAADCQPSRQHSAACLAAAAANVDRLVDALEDEALPNGAEDEAAASSALDVDASEQDVEAVPGNPLPLASLPAGSSIQAATPAFGSQPATTFEVGRLALLANGSCIAQEGQTQVLAAVACNGERTSFRRDSPAVPLQVEFRERQYTVGRVPTTWNKSEGAPGQREMLASCAIEQALRPLFPPDFTFDTQVTANVLCADGVHDTEVLAINAASAALAVSPLPWAGPIGAVRVAVGADGEARIEPSTSGDAAAAPRLRMLVAGTRDRIVLLEAEGRDASEEDFAKALAAAEPAVADLIAAQEKLVAEAQVHKQEIVGQAGPDPAAMRTVAQHAQQLVASALRSPDGGKAGRTARLAAVRATVTKQLRSVGSFRFENSRLRGSGTASPADVDAAIMVLTADELRDMALADCVRVDGRGPADLRPQRCEVGSVPVVHGSALVQRGETQSLATATITSLAESAEGSSTLVVHFTTPPFASNEVMRRDRGTASRQEVAQSEVVRRALAASLPLGSSDFPWVVRLNADTLSADGAPAMAAVCAGSLVLHAAGLPVEGGLTAGVSVGLLTRRSGGLLAQDPVATASGAMASVATDRQSSDSRSPAAAADLSTTGTADNTAGWFHADASANAQREFLIDTQELEDAVCDMTLAVAGSRSGITAVQLMSNTAGVTADAVLSSLAAARAAHEQVLDVMEAAAGSTSTGPPKFGSVSIDSSKIGRLIGTGGATIKSLEATTGARFAIQDSGTVQIFAPSGYAAAADAVTDVIGGNVQVGQRYAATVRRTMDYGAFVELAETGGTQALLHISELEAGRVQRIGDVLQDGDKLTVVVVGRDQRGNLRLSRKPLLGTDDDRIVRKQ